jgi:hypothetical protein
VADQVGSVTFGITKANNSIPSTSIVDSAPPALVAQQLVESTAVSTWTKTVLTGDVFGFSITGTPTFCTRASLFITIQRS